MSRDDDGAGWDAAGKVPQLFSDPSDPDGKNPKVLYVPAPRSNSASTMVRLFSTLALVISVFVNGLLVWNALDAPNARAEVSASRVELNALREELRLERERTAFYQQRLRAASGQAEAE